MRSVNHVTAPVRRLAPALLDIGWLWLAVAVMVACLLVVVGTYQTIWPPQTIERERGTRR